MLTSPKRCIIDIFAPISLNGIGLFCVRVHVRKRQLVGGKLCVEKQNERALDAVILSLGIYPLV